MGNSEKSLPFFGSQRQIEDLRDLQKQRNRRSAKMALFWRPRQGREQPKMCPVFRIPKTNRRSARPAKKGHVLGSRQSGEQRKTSPFFLTPKTNRRSARSAKTREIEDLQKRPCFRGLDRVGSSRRCLPFFGSQRQIEDLRDLQKKAMFWGRDRVGNSEKRRPFF